MDIQSINPSLNAGLTRSSTNAGAEERVNAFGIGPANRPEVELSPQARILQQNEQTQNERRQALEQQSQNNEEELPDTTQNKYVRVTSSIGTAQRNSLTAEQAAELYQSIEKLI